MRLLLAASLALLPMAAAAAPQPQQNPDPRCTMALSAARGTGSVRPHTLDREPGATAYFTVLRGPEGCYQPVLVSSGIRSRSARPPR